ncbi:exosome complex component RRP45 [Scaptodrosophila lebanonensis]|uniref:Exosome complex component RRP45 n=1 Tax=Drosophila lebanonensis TaxID=7225 RepID=A0A6J2U2J0_DROLE|nr:exosome complex component RRP45 [Scaptodrosophila lebanonensis]
MFLNSNLFEPGKSKLERNFVQVLTKQNNRLDGRSADDFRDVELTFGAEWGIVALTVGQTRVLAEVTCEIDAPTSARPNEGALFLNVDIDGVSFLDEVQTTHDQRVLALNSLLERTFRSSRCLDLESLCIASEQHVWYVRVNVKVLNHDGNLYDACTTAALAALMHFRRPDVTYNDKQIRTYSEKERELVPMLFLHYPVSVTYCVYKSSSKPVVDPTLLEENAADSVIVLSFNSYQELCTLNAGGSAPTTAHIIMQCARNASRRCKSMVQFIRKALALDTERRQAKQPVGLLELMRSTMPKITYNRLMNEESDVPVTNNEPVSNMATVATPQHQEPQNMIKEQRKQNKQEPVTPMDDSTWLPSTDEVKDKDNPKLKIKETLPQVKETRPKGSNNNRGKGKGGKNQKPKRTESDSEEETKPVI